MSKKNQNKGIASENLGAVKRERATLYSKKNSADELHTSSLSKKEKRAGKKSALKVMAKNHNKSSKFATTVGKNKKVIVSAGILVGLIILLGIFALIFGLSNKEKSESLGGDNQENYNAERIINGDKGYISSAQIIQTKTGTGPFDSDDQPGNDSSEDNNIVRSFDQVTWTVDLTMALKSGVTESGLKGGIINVNATLPENCANVMKWDLSAMSWLINGQVSSDGRTLTGQYNLSEEETKIPGKQTLVFVLQVYGAGNGTEITPTFTFSLEGNNNSEKAITTGEKVIVSAKGKYNVQLDDNTSNLSNKATVNYGQGDISGRMYGYGFTVQLYNDNESKGLKGVEYPEGKISFDIDLKLERTEIGSDELEDITNECTPVLWNYRINEKTFSTEGNIKDRDMYNTNAYQLFDDNLPDGKYNENSPENSTYNSGNIEITQEGSKLKVTIDNYDFNGKFPHYNRNNKIYTDNIGTFSVGYLQIFVPDNEASTVTNRNYYLTISDNNMNFYTKTGININNQMKTNDDNLRIQHVLYKKGTYNQQIFFKDDNGQYMATPYEAGNAAAYLNQNIIVESKFIMSVSNDNDIYTANRFLKFDGDCFEPRYFKDGEKYKIENLQGNVSFRLWYVTKKDGTNWTSQTEINNANIEDMEIYENIEDIPNGNICIGVYLESVDGYISRLSGDNNSLEIPLKIKNTAVIGKTYGLVARTKIWVEKLNRTIYTITNKAVQWPTPEWDSENKNYIKTEYDESGNIISGTNSGGVFWGNSLLVVGANLHGDIRAIDSSNSNKVNYDLGKNENLVTYSVEPQLDKNENINSQISNVTLKAEVTIPKGLEYVAGSSKRGESTYIEPEMKQNSDGSTTLVWYIYGVTSGQAITPITFDANIDNETVNGTQYEVKFVVSEVIGDDGIAKIGNSEINFRTSTVSINIINLESHRLYKEVETPIIDKNGDIKYKVTYENKTDNAVPDFQMLDILSYNGDNRGSNFAGSYTINNINVKQTISGSEQANSNLTLYTTNSTTVRDMNAKNTGIGTDSIWTARTIGANLNEGATGFAIEGELAGRARLEIEVTINTNNNSAGNIYANNAMAQVYSNSEQIQTGTVKSQVVTRCIEGKVWQDDNYNGTIDDGEKFLKDITLNLINTSDNSQVATTTTDENGEYEFINLAKGKYKVQIEVNGTYYNLTQKEVGTNVEINSKFNTDTAETDEITRLDSIQSPELIEKNVNAGLTIKKIDIPVTKVWSDNNDEAKKRPISVIVVLKNGDSEIGRKELNSGNLWKDTFNDLPIVDNKGNEINYKVEEQAKNTDDLKFYTDEVTGDKITGYTITNTFEVPDEKVSVNVTKQWVDTPAQQDKRPTETRDITVNKVWNDNSNEAQKRPTKVTLKLLGNNQEYKQEIDSSYAGKDSNTWTYTFTGLDKYDENGNEINYAADEEDLGNKFYKKESITGDMTSGYTITNKFEVPNETVTVRVE